MQFFEQPNLIMIRTKYNFIKMSKVIKNQSYLQTVIIGLDLSNETDKYYIQIDKHHNKINQKINKNQYKDEINAQIIDYQHEYEYKLNNKICKKHKKNKRNPKEKFNSSDIRELIEYTLCTIYEKRYKKEENIKKIIEHENYLKEKRNKIDDEIEKFKKRKDIVRRLILAKKIDSNNAYTKYITLHNKLHNLLNNELNNASIGLRNENLDIKKTFFLMCQLESEMTTSSKALNKICNKNFVNIGNSTLSGKICKFDSAIIANINRSLRHFIENDLNLCGNLYSVDGSKLSLSKEMCIFNFPLARNKDTCHNASNLKKFKKNNKNILEEFKEQIFVEIQKKYEGIELNPKKINININKELKKEIINKKQELKINLDVFVAEQKLKKKNLPVKCEEDNSDSEYEEDDYEICEDKTQGTYCKALMTVILDVVTKIPIAIEVTNELDERKHILSMLNVLKKGDTIIMDRGYYSDELIKECNRRGIFVLLRLKSSYNSVKYMLKNNLTEKIFDATNEEDNKTLNLGIDFKIKIYRIKEKKYYVGTTNLQFSYQEIQDYYWCRWTVEEFFKKLKHNLRGWFYDVATKDALERNVQVQYFVVLFTQIMSHIAYSLSIELPEKKRKQINPANIKEEPKNKKKNYAKQINFADALDISIGDILLNILVDGDNAPECIIFKIYRLSRSITYVVPDRHNVRHAIIFKGKWYMKYA